MLSKLYFLFYKSYHDFSRRDDVFLQQFFDWISRFLIFKNTSRHRMVTDYFKGNTCNGTPKPMSLHDSSQICLENVVELESPISQAHDRKFKK